MRGILWNYIRHKRRPGWNLFIGIDETVLEDEPFNEIQENSSKDDWLHCFVKNNQFKASCSPCNITKMLRIFKEWAEPFAEEIELNTVMPPYNEETLQWFFNWYEDCCNKGLSCRRRIMISTIANPGWDLCVDLHNTNLENKKLSYVSVERTDDDWYRCFIEDGFFNGPGGHYNLFEVLEVFKKFVNDPI